MRNCELFTVVCYLDHLLVVAIVIFWHLKRVLDWPHIVSKQPGWCNTCEINFCWLIQCVECLFKRKLLFSRKIVSIQNGSSAMRGSDIIPKQTPLATGHQELVNCQWTSTQLTSGRRFSKKQNPMGKTK